jgi:hypothetical protein
LRPDGALATSTGLTPLYAWIVTSALEELAAVELPRPEGRLASAQRWLRRRPPILVPLAAGIAGFAVCALTLAWATHDKPVLHLQVAFDNQACCAWQVWVGGAVTGELTVLPLNAGEDASYAVPVYRSRVGRLFVAVGTQTGGSARIRRIWVTRGSRTVAEVTPEQLRRATVYQAKAETIAGGLELRSTGTQPAIDAAVSLDTHESALRVFLARLPSQRLISLTAIIVLGSVLLAFGAMERRGRRWLLAAVLVSVLVAVRGVPWLSWRLSFHDDVSRAVGYASYIGHWKSREQFILDLSALLAVGIAALVGIVHRRRPGAPADPVALRRSDAKPLPRIVSTLVVTAPVLAVALAAAPNLRNYIGPPPQYTPSFDANNFLFSQYLVQTTHLEPVKDFFWLYGFQWLFDKPAPWGPLISYGWFLTLWLFLALGTYVSLSRFFSGWSLLCRYFILTGLWLTANLTMDAPLTTRYVAPLGTLLLFAGIDRRDPWWSWKRVCFVVALFGSALFEPAQALYALVPIAFLMVTELLTEVVRIRGEILPWLAKTIGTIAIPVAGAAVVFWAEGIAAATVSYYEALTLSSSAYAFPSEVDAWVTHPVTLESFIFWAVPLTLALGVLGLFLRRDRFRPSYAVVAALGLLGVMLMQKQILRPHAATQIWLPLVFGLAYWAVSDTVLVPVRRWTLVLAGAGATAALVLVSGGYRQGWNAIAAGPDRVTGSVHALVHQRATFTQHARKQWVPATFSRFIEDKPVIRALERVPSVAAGRPVWILGDDTPITMMLQKSWPYYFSDMYDASPIDFQRKVIARLNKQPPARVVWNFSPSAMIFDAVPTPVRVPLLYEWAVGHLAPASRIGHFEILRPRRAADPIDLSWWRRRIGKRLDLGHIPAVAKVTGRSCPSGTGCASFLVIRFPSGTPRPPQVVIPVVASGLQFEVAFETGPESEYVIPLDRLWFWSASPSGARQVTTASTDGSVRTVVRRTPDPTNLY